MCNYNGYKDFYLSSGHPEHHNRNNTASSSLYKPKEHMVKWPWVHFDDKITVKTCSLDKFCFDYKINNIDFIWIDSQGAEYDIILGSQHILKKTRFLYTEYSNKELYKDQKTLLS